jgi:diacylglycerol kinase (ATP)
MIGVVSNPRAGKNARNPARIERLRRTLGHEGVIREAETWGVISHIAQEFRDEGMDILVIDGGDGTLHHVVSAFISVYKGEDLPPVALLRSGTMNTIANSLGIKGSSESILERVVGIVRGELPLEVVRTNTIKVNDRYGFIFGLGFPVSVLRAYYEGEGRGRGKSIRVVLKILLSMLERAETDRGFFNPFEAQIWIDGQQLPVATYTALLAATVSGVGLGFKPTRRARQEEGRFQSLCLGMGSTRIGLNAFRVLLGMELRGENLLDHMVTESVIKLRKSTDMQIDGEIFANQREIQLRIGPAVRFVRTNS